ncbi:hypothetical protein BDQ17DRAFT_1329359 [Cyathus striatus]|nr:hypothetical protein BDQ17DRAFT_1329359 [Cyathus striatus]
MDTLSRSREMLRAQRAATPLDTVIFIIIHFIVLVLISGPAAQTTAWRNEHSGVVKIGTCFIIVTRLAHVEGQGEVQIPQKLWAGRILLGPGNIQDKIDFEAIGVKLIFHVIALIVPDAVS